LNNQVYDKELVNLENIEGFRVYRMIFSEQWFYQRLKGNQGFIVLKIFSVLLEPDNLKMRALVKGTKFN